MDTFANGHDREIPHTYIALLFARIAKKGK
jgi:hypothetical protein